MPGKEPLPMRGDGDAPFAVGGEHSLGDHPIDERRRECDPRELESAQRRTFRSFLQRPQRIARGDFAKHPDVLLVPLAFRGVVARRALVRLGAWMIGETSRRRRLRMCSLGNLSSMVPGSATLRASGRLSGMPASGIERIEMLGGARPAADQIRGHDVRAAFAEACRES